MKKMKQGCLVSLLLFLSSITFAAEITPVGYWKVYDDVSGQQKAVMRLFENHGYLYGQIVKTITPAGVRPLTVCTACGGNRHNKPIIGMVIMEGLSQNISQPAEWNGGSILDPTSGKTYRCMLRVMNRGQKLNVRGYLGFSMLGRSQVWVRTGNTASQ